MPVSKELKARLYDQPTAAAAQVNNGAAEQARPGGTYNNGFQTTPATPAAETQPIAQPASSSVANVSAPVAAPAPSTAPASGMVAQTSYSTQGANLPPTPDYTQQINDIYDRALAAQRAQLDSGYEATMRELEAAAARLPGTYQQRGNDLNEQYERQRAALNEQMAANGLNIGAGSQARLAQNAGYQRAYGQIMAAQADAQAALEQQRAAQEAQYQAAITQALADNDYQRAVALTQELKDQRSADLDRAKTLASYGDFSGYAQIYGQDAANNMRDVWLAQNPQFAYMTGNLTAEQYRQLTGQYPADAQPQVSYAYTPAASTGDTGKGAVETTREIPGYENSGQGMDARAFGYLQQSFGSARTRAEALSLLNRLDDATQNSLSDQQKAQLVSIINAKG